MRKILIVGGGASGILVAMNLALNSKKPLSIVIADPRRTLGQGLAYSSQEPSHLLNVPAGRMSALVDNPDHFCQWSGLSTDAFAQRKIYGEYLNSSFEKVKSENSSVEFEHIKDSAISISSVTDSQFTVKFENSANKEFDAVVLAIGHGQPQSNSLIDKFKGEPKVYVDSWREPIASFDGTLLCIGTGLTFIDHALKHLRSNPENTVVGISRTGLLPKPHLPKRAPALEVPALAKASPLAVREFIERSSDWRAAQDGVRHELPEIWHSWSEDQKREFFNTHLRWWNIHRHRLSPEIDVELRAAIENNRIKVLAGELTGIEKSGDQFEITTSSNSSFKADAIVNCLGYQVNGEGALFSSLIQSGNAILGPLGQGLVTNYPKYGVINSGHKVNPGLYALGPILLGERFETTAIPELRVQANEVALELISELR